MGLLQSGKRLPKQMYAIKLSRKGDNEQYSAADTYATKGDIDARLKRIKKFSYQDETVEILKAVLTWEPVEVHHGEIERKK